MDTSIDSINWIIEYQVAMSWHRSVVHVECFVRILNNTDGLM